jgi:hypothetical protein
MRIRILLWMVLAFVLASTAVGLSQAQSPSSFGLQDSSFTYQGQLKRDTLAVSGMCDFRFGLWDAEADGGQIGATSSKTNVLVSRGLFTVLLDFGPYAFTRQARWLEIEVRCPSGTGEYSRLEPRQVLSPTPNAIYAGTAPWSGLVGVPEGLEDGDDDTLSSLKCAPGEVAKWDGTQWSCATDLDTPYIAGEGLSLIGPELTVDTSYVQRRVDASCGIGSAIREVNSDGTVTCEPVTGATGSAWLLGGNAGTTPATQFLGTTDGVSLTLIVSGTAALRLTPAYDSFFGFAPNIVGGYSGNTAANGAVGGAIGGGGAAGAENRVLGNFGSVGGGRNNEVTDGLGTIGGGYGNTAGEGATVAGGGSNTAGAESFVGGGFANVASNSSMIGGGQGNRASDNAATIGGGEYNTASGQWATIGGGYQNSASERYTTVGGGRSNDATGLYDTVCGGEGNDARGSYAFVGGGKSNAANASFAIVGGGQNNTASNDHATVGGGGGNAASFTAATVAGGWGNTASAGMATVSGGSTNAASGTGATVSGGSQNSASGSFSTVAGGWLNVAQGDYAFAAGNRAVAQHVGTFVWGDSTNADLASSANNQFIARASGGFYFYTNSALSSGVRVAAGGSAWSSVSDRNLKDNFARVDGAEVLARLSEIPISTWNYKAQDASIRHMGPVAQDLYAAFGLGEDDTHISTIDADGVALAALQGAYQLLQEKEVRITDLEARVSALETLVAQLLQIE